jgi:hypothetical protein
MGYHPFEITLNSKLFNQGPTAIGISLKTERSTEHTTVPTQAIGGCDLQRALDGLQTLRGLQGRFDRDMNTT